MMLRPPGCFSTVRGVERVINLSLLRFCALTRKLNAERPPGAASDVKRYNSMLPTQDLCASRSQISTLSLTIRILQEPAYTLYLYRPSIIDQDITSLPRVHIKSHPTMSSHRSSSMEAQENIRKRVCKACDRCRLKKSKVCLFQVLLSCPRLTWIVRRS
jgi:hypothetical protein